MDNRLIKIKLLLLDVDGVLTSGDIIYTDEAQETKVFNVKDGLGIRLLKKAGVQVGVVTGRRSAALDRRCRELGIDLVYAGVDKKASILPDILEKTGLSSEEVAFIGDDLPDLPLMKRVGTGVAVADASETVRKCADFVTQCNGGHGAVRELCELILKAKGLWGELIRDWD